MHITWRMCDYEFNECLTSWVFLAYSFLSLVIVSTDYGVLLDTNFRLSAQIEALDRKQQIRMDSQTSKFKKSAVQSKKVSDKLSRDNLALRTSVAKLNAEVKRMNSVLFRA